MPLTRLCDGQKGHGGDQEQDLEQGARGRRHVVHLDGAVRVVAVDAVPQEEQHGVREHGSRKH